MGGSAGERSGYKRDSMRSRAVDEVRRVYSISQGPSSDCLHSGQSEVLLVLGRHRGMRIL